MPFPSDNLVFSSSGVLFWAVSCDLVGKGREAVPVSQTAIDPLEYRYVDRLFNEPTIYHSRQTVHSFSMAEIQYNDVWVWMCKGQDPYIASGEQP